MAKHMTLDQAATLMGGSARHTRHILAAYRERGTAAVAHGHRSRKPTNATPEPVATAVIFLARTRYAGTNHTHLSELLSERDGIDIGKTTPRRILVKAGLSSPRRRRQPKHRIRRQRMPWEGMLIQMDGSHHPWLGDRMSPFTLLIAVDYATGTVVCHRRRGAQGHCFVIDLPHSNGCFVKAHPTEPTEAFLDGHVSAFAFLGGVPQSILYDNTRLAVAKILGDGRRQRTRAFTELQSHYLFEDRFGRPGKGNDKGKVEGLVGYVRRNFLVPVPSFESFDALNAYLERRCLERMDAQLRGHTETIGQRMERDLDALLPLPPVAYDACDKQASRVSSLSLVRYRTNDYSVPVAYGYRDVLVRGYVEEVVISCGSEVIARHPRSYERDDFVYDPVHYLPLLERKPGALDQVAPLQGWALPDEFGTLRRLLESRMGRRGKREYVQVLRLLETFNQQEVHAAVKDAIHLGSLSFDAVKHLVLCQLEGRPPRLDMELYPYLPRVRVSTTSAGDYMALLSGRAA